MQSLLTFWQSLDDATRLLLCGAIVGAVMAGLQGLATRWPALKGLTKRTANLKKQLLAAVLVAVPALLAGHWSADTTAQIVTLLFLAFGANQGAVVAVKALAALKAASPMPTPEEQYADEANAK